MCGIAGFINKNTQPADLAILQKMTRRLASRGPDDEGYFIKGSLALGHRRLSIIDLSGGHQPMSTPDGRYTIVFNGEIYNFAEIRSSLEKEGVSFTTHSDTEVLLKAYQLKGPACLDLLNGMFAFAIWDEQEKNLFAARDRMGKKPFYYWNTPGIFAFASECKSLLAHPDFKARLDPLAARLFFQYEYVPSPYSIFEGIKKLPAGHYLLWKEGTLAIHRYWDISLGQNSLDISEETASVQLLDLLDKAVQRRLISDVPLGVFLSGGIDSSSIVALMARHRKGSDIKTFSIGFEEKSFDESSYAQMVATRFETDHHHQILTPHKLIEVLPSVTSFLDEPFADASVIPTYLLSQFTRQTVTVALGGDGGDELFAGYPTFFADKMAESYSKLPELIKKSISGIVESLPVSHKNMSLDFKAKQFLYGANFSPLLRNQVWLGAYHQAEQEKLFCRKTSENNPLDLVVEQMKNCSATNNGDRLLYFYTKFYLCDDILVKADRASMASSLEVRAPYLDRDVVEFAARLPYSYKLKGKQTKYILKKALTPLLPHEILYRPKKGFGIPIAHWLRHELKQKMLDQLHPEKIKREGIFNADYVSDLVNGHLSGKKDNRKKLFSLLMFEWWREKYLS